MIRSPLVECRRKVATLFLVGQMQSASATYILVAQGTRHKAQGTRGQSTAKLIWKRVWSQAVRQVGVGSRLTPSYQSGTLTLPPPQT